MRTTHPFLLSLAIGGALVAGAVTAQTKPSIPTQANPPTTTATMPKSMPVVPAASATSLTARATTAAPTDQRLQQQQRTLHNQVRSMSSRRIRENGKPVATSPEPTSLYPATSGTH